VAEDVDAGRCEAGQTAAKLRRDAGASVEAVSAFLDHSSLAATTVYLRRLEGETDKRYGRTWRSRLGFRRRDARSAAPQKALRCATAGRSST